MIEATKIPADTLGIFAEDISPNAIEVVNTLQDAGYQAYVVGGGIRDLLLDLEPKDFDVATDAHPDTVKELFGKNCRLVGRRFRLAHVRIKREIIEVATFRAAPDNINPENTINPENPEDEYNDGDFEHEGDINHEEGHAPGESISHGEGIRHGEDISSEGLLLRDNVFGTLEEDAIRRDFTVNALYYDPSEHVILDFFNGLEDLDNDQLVMIGCAQKRCQEDPVRTLRAARLASKLDFEIPEDLEDAIAEQSVLLDHVPPARKFDEFLKLFIGGYATQTLQTLLKYDLLIYLFPCCSRIESHPYLHKMIEQTAINTDERIKAGKHITPAFLLAAILWYSYTDKLEALKQSKEELERSIYSEAFNSIIFQQSMSLSIPKRFSMRMREIWELQSRLAKRQGKLAFRTLEHPRFRAAYDFLLLRESIGEIKKGLGDWWTEFQFADTNRQQAMVQALGKKKRKKKPKNYGNQALPNSPSGNHF